MSSPSPTHHGGVRRRPSSGPVTRDEGRLSSDTPEPKNQSWSNPRALGRSRRLGDSVHTTLQGVPDVVIQRLPLYLRALTALPKTPGLIVTSTELAAESGVSAAQIRKDLSHFRPIGHPGRGYDVRQLAEALQKILGGDQRWNVIIYGAGRLGRSLATHPGFEPNGFHVAAIVDPDPALVGETVGQLRIQPASALKRIVEAYHVRIGIAALSASSAQAAADAMVRAGIQAILNYAPIGLQVPASVAVREIDPIATLRSMTFYLHDPSPDL